MDGRAGNEPSYSGSAQKKLDSGSARELNEPSLSLNLGLINIGLGSSSAQKKLCSGHRDLFVAGTRFPPTVSDWQDLVFTSAIPTQARRSEMPRSCVSDIDVMNPQDLDPVDMDDKCVNPYEAVKEALTTKTIVARVNPTPSAGGNVPRSPDLLGSENGTHDSAKVLATVCSSANSVKKVPVKGTSGKDMDVGYDPLVRSVDPCVQESDYKYEGIGAPMETIEAGGHELRQGLPILSSIESKCTDPLIRSIQPDEQGSNLKSGGIGASLDTGTGLNPAHLGMGMGKGIKGDRGVGFHRGNKETASGTARTDGVTPRVPPSAVGMKIWADRFDMVGKFWISSPAVVKLWVLKLIIHSLVVRRVVANLTMCCSILPNSFCCY